MVDIAGKANCSGYLENGGKGRMNLQVGIFAALLVVEFFTIRIADKLDRIIDLLKEIKNKEA